jgi:pectate lyase
MSLNDYEVLQVIKFKKKFFTNFLNFITWRTKMATTNFSEIDNNRIATARQVYAVACHFANIHSKSPSERFGLTKVFNAILNKSYKDSDSYMTHGDATDFLEHQVVPKQFLHMVSKPKAQKKSVAKKKATTNSVAVKLDNRVTALESKITDVDGKLTQILDILSK